MSAALERATELTGRLPEALATHYLEKMPRLLVEQMFGDDDPAAQLLWRPPGAQPRLAAALAALGEPTAAPAWLHARGLFGGSAPLLGAFPAERALMNTELAAGGDPDAILDLRLSGPVVHELCHGQPAPMPWTILEAVGLTTGARARPEHVFPDVPGEAVPGVALFVCVGEALARLYGSSVLEAVRAGRSAAEVFGAGPAAAFERAGWSAWLGSPGAPFVRDALDAFDWVRLADRARGVPWFDEAPTAEDAAYLASGVRALFQVNVMAPTFQTHPAELPERRFMVDVEAGELRALPRPEGVFGEPARWMAPPPWCRLVGARGVRRIVVEEAWRARRETIAATLWELATGGSALPGAMVIRCSR